MNRSAQIIRTSIVGIVTNVLLAAFKALVGFLSSRHRDGCCQQPQ